jgi:acetyl-CoA carboxylase biotin carboxyl carrier protein
VVAPIVGTFYRADPPDGEPLVAEGSRVEDDTVVAIIDALQVPTPVEAGCAGVVTRVMASDGEAVEYGQPLFEVALDG